VPIVRKYLARVEEIENSLENIYTVTFSSNRKFKYLPGQFLHLALDEYDGIGQWPESRCFSMQSNPSEELVKITFAIKGDFTNRMANELDVGKEVWLKMPFGDIFQRGYNMNNCVFIAGGTGITPFLSLFTDDSFNKYINPKIYLGFCSKKYNLYQSDINKIKNETKQIRLFYEDKDGKLDIKHILHQEGNESTYFISGPPIMTKNFKNYLIRNKVLEQKIITDDWE
jgi:predicted ferric reductase